MRLAHRHPRHLADMAAPQLHAQRLRAKPVTRAGLAGRRRLILRQILPHPGTVGLAEAPVEIAQNPLKRAAHLMAAAAIVIDKQNLLPPRSAQNRLPRRRRQIAPGDVHRKSVMRRQTLQRLPVIGRRRAPTRPRRNRTLPQTQTLVGNHQIRVGKRLNPKPVTGRTCSPRAVERKQPRLNLLNHEARNRTGKTLRKQKPPIGHSPFALAASGGGRVFNRRQPAAQLQRRLKRIRQTLRLIPPQNDPVNHNINIVLDVLVQRRRSFQFVIFAVHLDPLKPLLEKLAERAAILPLAPAHSRREQMKPAPLRQRRHPVNHFAHGLALNRQAGRRRIGNPGAREEQAHIVVNLGDRPDRRARIARGRLLLNRNRRRQALDPVDIGLGAALQKLAGIGRQTLDIAALALGIDRVEGQRRLARTRQARDHHQSVARNREADILQIMLARADDMNRPLRRLPGGLRRACRAGPALARGLSRAAGPPAGGALFCRLFLQ